jgi:hypothetical protein
VSRPDLSTDEALRIVNYALSVDAAVTANGDEVKCWTHDEDNGGRSKTYLDADQCADLASAFASLAASLRVGGDT